MKRNEYIITKLWEKLLNSYKKVEDFENVLRLSLDIENDDIISTGEEGIKFQYEDVWFELILTRNWSYIEVTEIREVEE